MNVNLGFDGDLAIVASVAGGITKWAAYPLAQLRRRIDANGDGQLDDDARGAFYIHPDLHGAVSSGIIVAIATVFAVAAGEALFPVWSAALSGWGAARLTHESVQAARSPR